MSFDLGPIFILDSVACMLVRVLPAQVNGGACLLDLPLKISFWPAIGMWKLSATTAARSPNVASGA